MLNVILVALMVLCMFVGLVVLLFPFGEERIKVTAQTRTTICCRAGIKLDELREQARRAKAEDIQIFVIWFEAFHGYNRDIPSSVRYQHMLEWRELTDKLYKELPVELAQPWASIVHPR